MGSLLWALCHRPWSWGPLSLTISWSLPKFMFVALVLSSNHLILWCLPLLLPSIFPSITDFSNESHVYIRWPKYWSYTFYIYRYKIKIQFQNAIFRKFKNKETRFDSNRNEQAGFCWERYPWVINDSKKQTVKIYK